MKAVRSLTAAVALVALSILPAVAQAHAPNQERGPAPVSRPADQTRAQRTLTRVLAREHHASPAPIDREAETAQRTLAKEHHAYPAPADSQQAANAREAGQSRTFPLLPVLAVVGLIVVLATAVTWLRLRARSRPREAT